MGKGKRKRQGSPGQSQSAPAKGQNATATKQGSSAKRVSPAIIVAGVGVAAVILIAIIAGQGAQSVTVVDGQVSRVIATVDECAFTTIDLSIPSDVTTEEAASTIFDTLSTEPGVGRVTVYEDDARVEIDYCQSYNSEPRLREVLVATGYVSEQSAPAPTPEAESAPAPSPESDPAPAPSPESAPAPGSVPAPESPRQ